MPSLDFMNDIDSVAPRLTPSKGPAPKPSAINVWPPQLLKDWAAGVPDDQGYLLDGILQKDVNVLVSGKAKRGYKTWLTMSMGMLLASGKSYGPFVPVYKEGMKVAYFYAEGMATFTKRRFNWLAKGLGLGKTLDAVPNFYFSHREPLILNDPAHLTLMHDWVLREQIKVVFIDTMIMYIDAAENEANEMNKVFRAMNAIRNAGATVIFVHHVRKESNAPKEKDSADALFEMDPDEDVRGTSGIIGFYDQHLAIRSAAPGPLDASPQLHLLLRSKDDASKYYKLDWHISGDTGTAAFDLREVTAQQTLSAQQNEVTSILSTTAEPVSKKRIDEMLGIGDSTVVLKSMVEAGMLKIEGRGYLLAKIEEI